MKNYILVLSIFALSVGVTACKSTQNIADNAHNSKNSLDWQGVYTGVTPCADCEGIQTILRIDTNNNYQLETSYLGKVTKPFIEKGTFSWDKSGGRIKLDNSVEATSPSYYLVGENQLIQLNSDGKPVMSELASKYILKKENNAIVEKYWKLVELNGRPVTPPAEGEREAHLMLKTLDNRITGNGGCNGFGGTYEILPGNRIRFSQILSTMMACPNLKDEQELFKVLETVDNYSYSNDTMTLNKARMAPLAKFVAVYF
ncbi:copper resistance protein NlpE N-terminal domain-containing protein [Pedobacter arcticus]|uniref:copper resistance protein NlpE N-terminal domain-containing protein n=1 Tax=Pedobacter arcticus TaxID=752140 RepID=UPI0002F44EB2|nr:copper resistance protein NlpE N-terminal domain-containing protein [Pedobacter arcticus]